jgi:hypothetical protein
LALAGLLAGVLPATSAAQSAGGEAGRGAVSTVALGSLETGATNYFMGRASVPLAAEAAGDVAKVEFYADGQLLATDTAAPYEGRWTNVAPGQYTVTTKAYDDSGEVVAGSRAAQVQVLAKPTVVASTTTAQVRQGRSTSFEVSLATRPASPVTVQVRRASGSSDLAASPGTLVFTPEDWDRPRKVTVGSADNGGALGKATFEASAPGFAAASVPVQELSAAAPPYDQAFLTQYNKLKNPSSGYFRTFGSLLVPYHSIETLIVEAPDHGHQTTSEAFSYYLWLESEYGRITGDWAPFNRAYQSLERYAIPPAADQPTNSGYNASKPATYAAEYPSPKSYPSRLDPNVPVGQDPLAAELRSAYGTSDIYGMHWLLDVDNTYGFGRCGDRTTAPAFINTFQRGSQESVWETVTQPSCDTFAFGGRNGYLDLFTGDSSYAKQWKYTNAPDADARVVQVVYQAKLAAAAQGKSAQIADVVRKASKMGDYLRYSFFDKYFKRIGNCVGPSTCPAGSGKNSSHYLLSWYYAWGGSLDTSNAWAWRIGDGAAHQGYQNPMAAYALANDAQLRPVSSTGASDWSTSLTRQLEFMRWLQSSEGGIAGGATNSWDGQYGTPPSGSPTFYGMFYDPQPVWHDPPSNRWFGFQVWSMERFAELYQRTGNTRAKALLDKWVPWAIANTQVGTNGNFQVPADLSWSGRPNTWNPSSPGTNTNLHVSVVNRNQDVGVAAALAKTLMYYAKGSGHTQSRTVAEGLLDALLAHQTSKGITTPETRADYNRFTDTSAENKLYIPSGWTGTMPNGDAINSSSTFLSIRSFYRSDPDWPKVQSYLNGGSAPTFTYHRFWAQTEIATAFAKHGQLFG